MEERGVGTRWKKDARKKDLQFPRAAERIKVSPVREWGWGREKEKKSRRGGYYLLQGERHTHWGIRKKWEEKGKEASPKEENSSCIRITAYSIRSGQTR